jgi:hypothetical protein
VLTAGPPACAGRYSLPKPAYCWREHVSNGEAARGYELSVVTDGAAVAPLVAQLSAEQEREVVLREIGAAEARATMHLDRAMVEEKVPGAVRAVASAVDRGDRRRPSVVT